MNKIIIRADGNPELGSGHIMRCLAIANAARKRDIECIFVTADNFFSDVINHFCFRNIVLNTKYDCLDPEISKLLKIIATENVSTILIDSYFVTEKYLNQIHKQVKTIYIDDMYSFPYEVDLLTNYNIYSDEKKYLSLYNNSKCPKMLLGLRYAPLRDEFQHIEPRKNKEKVENILVSAGGADPEGMALRIAKILVKNEIYSEKYTFHFVIGAFEPNKKEINELAFRYPWIKPHENITKMSLLMQSCDLAVSAAGSTLYELCACGLPTITYILADNQKEGAHSFEDNGLMINAGDVRFDSDFDEKLFQKIVFLVSNKKFCTKVSERQQKLIDGQGASRIVDNIISFM